MNLETGRLEGVGKQLIIVEVPGSALRDNKATLLYQHYTSNTHYSYILANPTTPTS